MYVNYKTWSGNAISSNLWKSAWATSVVQFCKTDCSVEAAGVWILLRLSSTLSSMLPIPFTSSSGSLLIKFNASELC